MPPPSGGHPHHAGFAAYIARAAAASWVSNLLAIAYAFFITPIVIAVLHEELYGVWSYLNGLLAYSNLFYLGLGSAVIKYVAEYRVAGRRELVNRIASVVLVIYTSIGLFCAGACLLAAPWVPKMFATPLGAAETHQAVIACALLGFQLLFMFVSAVFSGLLIAAERIALSTSLASAMTVVRFIAVPLLIEHNSPLVMLAAIVTVTTGIQAVLLWVAVWRVAPDVRMRPAKPTLPELRLLYGFGLKSFFILLSSLLVNYTDTTVIGVLLGAGAVGFYAVPLQLAAYGRLAVRGVVSGLLPRLTAYEARGDRQGMRDAYLRISRAASYLAAFIAFNLVTLGTPFIARWIGDSFATAGTVSLTLLAFAGYCQVMSTQTSVPFFQAMESFRAPVTVLLIEAIVNLVLSLWLADTMGIAGVALATLLPAAAVTGLFLPRALCRRLAISGRTYVVSAILPSVYLLGAGLLVNYPLNALAYPASYWLMVLRGLGNVLLALAIGAVVLPSEDRALFRRVINRLRPRRPALPPLRRVP
jgi:O-antigen/teichoic acid export membrane protein